MSSYENLTLAFQIVSEMGKVIERANLLLSQMQRNEGNCASKEAGPWQGRSLQPHATEGLES